MGDSTTVSLHVTCDDEKVVDQVFPSYVRVDYFDPAKFLSVQ